MPPIARLLLNTRRLHTFLLQCESILCILITHNCVPQLQGCLSNPTLCEVGRKEERETFDGKVGGEPLSLCCCFTFFSFWEGRLQVVVSLGFFIWLTIPYFFTSYVSLTSKGQRKLYIHVTTLAEKHIVSIRGILPSAISYCLASARDFIAQFS